MTQHSIVDLFDTLADETERRWLRSQRQDDRGFLDAAAEALAAIDHVGSASPGEVLSHIARSPAPARPSGASDFAEIFTIAERPGFSVNVHFCGDGLVPLHCEEHCSVFQVLAGSFAAARADFQLDDNVSGNLRLGRGHGQDVEVVLPGFVMPAPAGIGCCWAMGCLTGMGGMGVSLRRSAPGAKAFRVHRPHLVVAPEISAGGDDARARALAWLVGLDEAEFEVTLSALAGEGDLDLLFTIRMKCAEHGIEIPPSVVDIGRQRFGKARFDRFWQSFDDAIAHRDAISIRRRDHSDDVHLVTAALFLATQRNEVFRIISEARPRAGAVDLVARTILRAEVGVQAEENGPETLLTAFADIVDQYSLSYVAAGLRERGRNDPDLESHLEIAGATFNRLHEAPLYKVLFRD